MKFDFLGLKTLTVLETARELLARRGHRRRSRRRCRSTTRRPTSCCQRGDTVGVFQLEVAGMRDMLKQAEARPLRGHHRPRRALPPGPDGQHPDASSTASTGEEPIDYLHPLLEPILKETYGVIVYQEQVMQIAQVLAGYLARRRRPAAPRHGQEDQDGDGRSSRAASSRARSSNGVERGTRRVHLRPDGQVRRLRLQQVARRGLRAGRLSDRLSQGQLPGRVHGRLDDARHGQHRQAQRLRPGSAPHGHSHPAALRQPLRGRLPARATAPSAIRWRR